MHILERRLQILIDEPRYRRLSAVAKSRGTSVARVVRDAIDDALGDDADARRDAWARIASAEAMPVPETVEALKAEIEGIRGGRFDRP